MSRREDARDSSSGPWPPLLARPQFITGDPAVAAAQRVPWILEVWRDALPDRHRLLERLRDLDSPGPDGTVGISRQTAHSFADSPADELLVVSMVWGFGRVGYGPFRTARMLSGRDARARLERIREATLVDAASGFSALWDARRAAVPYLGTSMGTKFLYFAAGRSGAGLRPLVFDVNVLTALSAIPGLGFPSTLRRVDADAYARYIRLADAWAGTGMRDSVELELFNRGLELNRRQSRRRVAPGP